MIPLFARPKCLAICMMALLSTPLQAQTAALTVDVGGLITLGSTVEDQIRLRQLLGERTSDGWLIRSPSSLTPRLEPHSGQVRVELLAPEIRSAWNSDIPLSLNDGAMWAGRGASLQVMAGARVTGGPVTLLIAPQAIYAQNHEFQIQPSEAANRSAFASPWYVDGISADFPLRFGNESIHYFDPGQSTLSVAAGPVSGGFSTENQWWGPGIRNSIILSNQAAGFPHGFLRTDSPIRTRLGTFAGKWIVGGLTESLYFDTVATNDVRSLSAFALTYQPAGEPNLTLGVARSVYANVTSGGAVLHHAADVLTHWRRTPAPEDSTQQAEADQIISLFGRWAFPEDGLEIYGEWARLELPSSVRDYLAAPNHSQGYTLGLQWARPWGANLLRLQGEVTYLEESATFKQRAVGTYYTSRIVPQGYTHRGQALGASIGPGASSQWAAADFFRRKWNAGLFANRIRWNTDAFYTTRSPASNRRARSFHAYDVSIVGGTRAGYDFGPFRLDAEFALESRINYLFQNPDLYYSDPGVDILNHHFQLSFTPKALSVP